MSDLMHLWEPNVHFDKAIKKACKEQAPDLGMTPQQAYDAVMATALVEQCGIPTILWLDQSGHRKLVVE